MSPPDQKKIALYLYMFQEVILGYSFNVVYGSLLEYLTILKADHIKLWYNAICAAFFLSSLLIGPLVGIWNDKTKKSVFSLLGCNFIIFCGAFIYCIPYSPWFLLAGRFLLGFVYIGRSLIIANLSDIYDESLLSGKLSFIFRGTSIGDFLGPIINIMIRGVHFTISGFNFTDVNVSLILIMICTFFQNIAFYFCLVYPTQKNTATYKNSKAESEKFLAERKSSDRKMSRSKRSFNRHVIMLIIIAGFGGFSYSLFSQIAPLVIKNLQYSRVYTNLYLGGVSFVSICVLSLIYLMKFEYKENLYGCVMMLLSAIMVFFGYSLSSKVLEDYFNIFVLCLNCLIFSIFFASFNVFPVALLQTIAEPSQRSFIESVRMSIDLFGRIFAGLCTSYIFDYIKYFIIVYVFIVFMIVYFLFKSRDVFCRQ